MSWLKLAEDEAEAILEALKGRVEYLFSGFGANAHSHLDPIIDALQAHVDAKNPVQTPAPVEEAAPSAPAESAVEPVAAAAPAESAPVAPAEQAPVAESQTVVTTAQA